MESNSFAEEQREENSQDDFLLEMIDCPNCRETVPKSIYCLKCGYPLYNLSGETEEATIEVAPDPFDLEPSKEAAEDEDDALVFELTPVSSVVVFDDKHAQELGDSTDSTTEESSEKAGYEQSPLWENFVERESELEETEDVEIEIEEELEEVEEGIEIEGRPDVAGLETPLASEIFEGIREEYKIEELYMGVVREMELESQPQCAIKELTKELMNTISLKLWAINLLIEGRVKEDHFNKLFDGYLKRSEECLRRRDEMLKRASDIESIERSHEEAKIGLGELEIRKSIGDLREGEYEAKAPAFQWDIRQYEEELSRRKEEVAFLRDLTKVVPTEEIVNVREMAQKADRAIDDLERSGKIGSETAAMIRTTLKETATFLEDFESARQ